jgi:uncharacterized membrane protein YfcA
MIGQIITVFTLGIVSDFLAALYYLFVGRLQAVSASLTTILITLLSFFVISTVVVNLNWILVLIYALGCATGSFILISAQKNKLKKKNSKSK